jgi:hypothetical protein
MNRRPIFPSCIVVAIVNAIIRVFSRAKRPAKDVIPEEKRKRLAPLVLHRFRRRRDSRGSLPYTPAEMTAYSCGTAAHDPTSWIEILPNEILPWILLENFDCLRLAITQSKSSEPSKWHRLAHVCQRWRNLVFEPPHLLDLRLVYTYKNPLRRSLDLWPLLPISGCYPKSPHHQRLAPEDEEKMSSPS